MCLPGPCSTCRDPWVVYYDRGVWADFTKRHVCNDCTTPSTYAYGTEIVENGYTEKAAFQQNAPEE